MLWSNIEQLSLSLLGKEMNWLRVKQNKTNSMENWHAVTSGDCGLYASAMFQFVSIQQYIMQKYYELIFRNILRKEICNESKNP